MLNQQKTRERECKEKVMAPTFSRTKIANIAVLLITVHFCICEV